MSYFTNFYSDLFKPEDPVALIGLPSTGLVGSILAGYIVKEKNMSYLGGFTCPDIPPYALTHEGRIYPPIRFYGLRIVGGRDFIIVTSEITPKPESCSVIAEEICATLADFGVRKAFVVEGIPQTKDSKPLVCGTDQWSIDRLKKEGFAHLTDGLVRGFGGAMLLMAGLYDIDITGVLCPARADMPDPRSASQLIGPLTKVFGGLQVGYEELLKEADEIERTIKDCQSDSDNLNFYG